MPMISYPIVAAKRDDCIWAVFPQRGGSVLNKIRKESTFYPVNGTANYGSWAEKTGMIELKNTTVHPKGFGSVFKVEDGYEVALKDATECDVSTPLDLRGNTTSKTFIARAYLRKASNDTPQQRQSLIQTPLIVCGSNWETVNYDTVIRFTLEERHDGQSDEEEHYNNRYLRCCVGLCFEPATVDRFGRLAFEEFDMKIDISDDYFNKLSTFALVVDYDSTPDSMEIRVYINGDLIDSASMAPKTWSTPSYRNATKNWYGASLRKEGDALRAAYGFVSWGMIFDSALTEEEIRKFN